MHQTADTPKILLDEEAGIFEFVGMSVPEDAAVFYSPIVDWLKEYSRSPRIYTELILKFNCLNSASARIFYEIISIMEGIYLNDKQVTIHWFYTEEDEDMEDFGKELQETYHLPIFVTNTEMVEK